MIGIPVVGPTLAPIAAGIAYASGAMNVAKVSGIKFEKGGIGPIHRHVHVQISHVFSGVFEVQVDGTKKTLKPGDSFFVPSNLWHGVVCLEAGILIDTFSPMREDFL